jgi:hypothetical protein
MATNHLFANKIIHRQVDMRNATVSRLEKVESELLAEVRNGLEYLLDQG